GAVLAVRASSRRLFRRDASLVGRRKLSDCVELCRTDRCAVDQELLEGLELGGGAGAGGLNENRFEASDCVGICGSRRGEGHLHGSLLLPRVARPGGCVSACFGLRLRRAASRHRAYNCGMAKSRDKGNKEVKKPKKKK